VSTSSPWILIKPPEDSYASATADVGDTNQTQIPNMNVGKGHMYAASAAAALGGTAGGVVGVTGGISDSGVIGSTEGSIGGVIVDSRALGGAGGGVVRVTDGVGVIKDSEAWDDMFRREGRHEADLWAPALVPTREREHMTVEYRVAGQESWCARGDVGAVSQSESEFIGHLRNAGNWGADVRDSGDRDVDVRDSGIGVLCVATGVYVERAEAYVGGGMYDDDADIAGGVCAATGAFVRKEETYVGGGMHDDNTEIGGVCAATGAFVRSEELGLGVVYDDKSDMEGVCASAGAFVRHEDLSFGVVYNDMSGMGGVCASTGAFVRREGLNCGVVYDGTSDVGGVCAASGSLVAESGDQYGVGGMYVDDKRSMGVLRNVFVGAGDEDDIVHTVYANGTVGVYVDTILAAEGDDLAGAYDV
jgi:hypothetical protein